MVLVIFRISVATVVSDEDPKSTRYVPRNEEVGKNYILHCTFVSYIIPHGRRYIIRRYYQLASSPPLVFIITFFALSSAL